jgi:hypothetical protein
MRPTRPRTATAPSPIGQPPPPLRSHQPASQLRSDGPPAPRQAGYAMNIYRVGGPELRRWLFGPPPAETYRNDIAFLRISVR